MNIETAHCRKWGFIKATALRRCAYTPGQKPQALSCLERVAPPRGRVWRGHLEIFARVGFALKTDLFARFRLGASGGELLVPPRSSARMRLKERRCQKAALSLRILSRPQNQSSLYLRGLRTAVSHSTGLGGKFLRVPSTSARCGGHLLQQEKAFLASDRGYTGNGQIRKISLHRRGSNPLPKAGPA